MNLTLPSARFPEISWMISGKASKEYQEYQHNHEDWYYRIADDIFYSTRKLNTGKKSCNICCAFILVVPKFSPEAMQE
jgi:hypothetical protein